MGTSGDVHRNPSGAGGPELLLKLSSARACHTQERGQRRQVAPMQNICALCSLSHSPSALLSTRSPAPPRERRATDVLISPRAEGASLRPRTAQPGYRNCDARFTTFNRALRDVVERK